MVVFLIVGLWHFSWGEKEAGVGLEAGCTGNVGTQDSSSWCSHSWLSAGTSASCVDKWQQPYLEGLPGPGRKALSSTFLPRNPRGIGAKHARMLECYDDGCWDIRTTPS